ncbi:MAG: YeiH family protein [Paracoccaceae bacterium]
MTRDHDGAEAARPIAAMARWRRAAHARGPGLALALVVAAAAGFLNDHYGAPVMLFALLIGMAFNFLADDPRCGPGLGFASRTLLRLGIVLLGARVTAGEIAAIGPAPFASVVALVALTIAAGLALARLAGLGWRLGLLTGGAVAICGASAALALAAVIRRGPTLERDTGFTVVAVTTLSTVAMIVYPMLFTALGLDEQSAGFLVGATIHDVAQVVGAGYSISETAGETATVVKLLRVALLPVVLVAIMVALSRRDGGAGVRMPGFVLGFLALAAANSLGLVPEAVAAPLATASRWLLVTAVAAIGVRTSLAAVCRLGPAHLGLVVAETLVLLVAATAIAGAVLPG